jgi:UDP-glucose 4-epimerase
MTWLVTGGAGYIGAHVVHALRSRGEAVVVIDDLSTGSADRVGDAELVVGSVLDGDLVRSVLAAHQVQGAVHLAAKKQVGESVVEPMMYYRENIDGLRVLLESLTAAHVPRLLFSSSAATYGMPDVDLVDESTPTNPINPYGETKLVGEWMCNAVSKAHGLHCVSMRYFNVAGAGEDQLGDPAALNLIPMVFERLEAGQAPKVFGDDYPTPDGTCIRDYVHVADLADAHAEALLRADSLVSGTVLNVGTGTGSSVAQVMGMVAEVTGIELVPEVVQRRAGDPPRLVASVDRIHSELGWTASHDLRDMVASAWSAWRYRHDQPPVVPPSA